MNNTPVKNFAYVAIKLTGVYLFIMGVSQLLEAIRTQLILNIDISDAPIPLDVLLYTGIPAIIYIAAAVFSWLSTGKIVSYFLPRESQDDTGKEDAQNQQNNQTALSREDIQAIGFSLGGVAILIYGIPQLFYAALTFQNNPEWFISAAIRVLYVITGLLLLFGSNNIGKFFGSLRGGISKMRKDFPDES